MTRSDDSIEDWARDLLAHLRSVGQLARPYPSGDAIAAIELLSDLHYRSADGQLPQVVDGRDFPAEAAQLFDVARSSIRRAAEVLVDRIDNAREEEMEMTLDLRSAVQFLADDFRGTVADDLVDKVLFARGQDGRLAEKIQDDAPFDFSTPPHVPASHWWWALAMGEKPAAGVDYPGRS